MLGVIKNIFG